LPGRRRIAAALGLVWAAGAAAPALAGSTERVSVGPGGRQANSSNMEPTLSADGRMVAFTSIATNLVPRDTNQTFDVFVHDRRTGVTTRASVGPGGAQANGINREAALSADGRFVAFVSEATNLVPGDTNGQADVFVRDLGAGTTRRVSVGPGGRQGNGSSEQPALSADGRFVSFASGATNLVSGDTNREIDVFVRDLQARTNRRVSVGPRGTQAEGGVSYFPTISADGRVVAFISHATNLVPGDTNGLEDVFVRFLATGTTVRANVDLGGTQGEEATDTDSPGISRDGRFVVFSSPDADLVPSDTNGLTDVFLRDLREGVTRRPSVGPGGVQGNKGSGGQAVSADGRVVAFASDATNLAPGDTNGLLDVLVRDRRAATTTLASVGPGGVRANGDSRDPAVSADGRVVAFESRATNLVPGDTNGETDIFVRVR
jgi:Tol biopolymer transport system component